MHDVVVLAGGQARRLGGCDKAALVVGGLALLDRVLTACVHASRVVVVGPERPTITPVTWTREHPVGGGPVPALRAGLEHVTAGTVVLLAADLPFLTSAAVQLLADRAPAVLTDGEREQWMCSAWPAADLRLAVADAGPRLGDLLRALGPEVITWEGPDAPWTDCDTELDLQKARRWACRNSTSG